MVRGGDVAIPKFLEPTFAALADLSLEQLNALCETLDDPKAVGQSPEAMSAALERDHDIKFQEAYAVFQFRPFLSGLIAESGAPIDAWLEAIRRAIQRRREGKLPDDYEQKADLIRQILEPKPRAELARKKHRLLTGPMKSLRRIEGVCDIRPLFNLERTRIDERLHVTIVRLALEDDEGNEDILTFQVNEDGLKEIADFLRRTCDKLGIMQGKSISIEDLLRQEQG